jgi:CRP-like cAMP-binding protein
MTFAAYDTRHQQNATGVRANRARQKEAAGPPMSLSDHIKSIADGMELQFARGETIFSQDEPADYVYRLARGTARLCRYMPDGRRYVLDFFLPGDIIGFAECPDLAASAEAVSEVRVTAFPRSWLDRLAENDEGLRRQVLCHLSASLLTAQHHLFVLGCQKAKERLASFLLRLADRLSVLEGERLNLTMSRQDIAEHLGVTVETISRMMTALRSDGTILIPNAHQIILRDVTALRTLAAED